MSRNAVESIVFAIAAVATGAVAVIFGLNILPSAPDAMIKTGTLMPYYLIWAMIWLTAIAGGVLAVFLVANGLKERD
jgi:hypothetical protein